MDKFDQLILQELISNARQPVAKIAEKVNLSRSAVSERIKKMEENGMISGYQVVLKKPENQQVSAFFEIFHSALKCTDVIPIIKAFPEVVQCHGISGETDLLVLCRAATIDRIAEIRSSIEQHPNITKVKTHIVMTEWLKQNDGWQPGP